MTIAGLRTWLDVGRGPVHGEHAPTHIARRAARLNSGIDKRADRPLRLANFDRALVDGSVALADIEPLGLATDEYGDRQSLACRRLGRIRGTVPGCRGGAGLLGRTLGDLTFGLNLKFGGF